MPSPGPPNRARRHLPLVLVLVAALALRVPDILAVHDDVPAGSQIFELGDGASPTNAGSADILGSATQPGPDWADIFDANGKVVDLFGGVAAAFLKDDLAQGSAVDATTFASNSDKNNDPINTWTWDAGNTPAKNDLSNVYAYAKVNPADGHLIVYVGVERLDPSGDSHLDVEFFQDQVGLDEAVPCNDPGPDTTPCSFVGNRTDNDLLVSMDYTKGGGLGSLVVHLFNSTTMVYDEVETVTNEGCNGVSAANLTADSICGFNNGGDIDGGPWPNFDRHGALISLLPGNAFTEIGIDGTAAAGGETPCISTIMAKSRTSQSFTAELKDFDGPLAFNVCGGDIQIGPDGVNEVGQPHNFTVTVNRTAAGASQPVDDGTTVNVTLNASAGANVTLLSDTCASPGTVNGTCTVSFTSPTPGNVTGHAEVNFTFGGVSQSLETDGSGNNSGDAVKRFVDAAITIDPPLDTNSVGEDHVFTVAVVKNEGNGSGFVPATSGHVDVSLNATGGASPVVNTTASTCDDAGDNLNATGRCILVFTSATAGNVTGHATVNLTVLGVNLTRSTNGTGLNSGDATKIFVDGSLAWTKVDNAGNPLGNATFEVCRTHTFDSVNHTLVNTTDACFNVTDDVAPDANATAGGFLVVNLTLGRYTVKETVPPPGFTADPDVVAVVINLTNPSATISEAFVDLRPVVKLTGFGYENEPTGAPLAGVVSGNTTYNVTMENFGLAAANLTVTLNITGPVNFTAASGPGPDAPAAGTDCALGCEVTWSGVTVAAGGEVSLTATVRYAGVADGSVVTAALSSSYTVGSDSLARTPSGSPAEVSFTIQAD